MKDSFAYKVKTVKGLSDEIWVYLDRAEVKDEDLSDELNTAFASIYFNLDKSNILVAYIDRVEKVVEVMKKYPTLEIEVSSYTDCRGSNEYNLALSERRSKAIIDYVQSRIERPERIYGKGYGEQYSSVTASKDYQLIVGAYASRTNIENMMKTVREAGYQPITEKVGNITRVIASQSDAIEELKTLQVTFNSMGIDSWITESPCVAVNEEEHQKNRRTDFKVIRL